MQIIELPRATKRLPAAHVKGLLVLLTLAAGCSDSPELGESCDVVCSMTLTCSDGYCTKDCSCGNERPLCWPDDLAAGCPPLSVCVVTAANGDGTCLSVCARDADCPAGQPGCAEAPDGTSVCVGTDFVWRTSE